MFGVLSNPLVIIQRISDLCQETNFNIVYAILSRTKLGEIDAYFFEPTFAYFVMMISTVLMAALAWNLAKRMNRGIRHFESVINAVFILLFIEFCLPTVDLKSSSSAIFKTSKISTHILIGYGIGYDMQSLLSIINNKDLLTCQKVQHLIVKAFITAVNFFVLYRVIIINIYAHYIFNFECSRLCRLFLGALAVHMGSTSKNSFVKMSWSMALANEFYNSYSIYCRFESVLPEMEINLLKVLYICFLLVSLTNIYNDIGTLDSWPLAELKQKPENVSSLGLAKIEGKKYNENTVSESD